MYHFRCKQCGKRFSRNRKRSKENPATFCSRACNNRSRENHENLTCPICGVNFTAPKYANRQYCSIDCFRESQKASMREHICQQCGKRFISNKEGRKYCSHKCAHLARKKLKSANCLNCGKKFKKRTAKDKYCSLECFHAYTTFLPRHQTCQRCGKTFTSNHKEQKYCSHECYGLSIRRDGPRKYAYYGRNWPKQRSHAIARDKNTCQRCGVYLASPNVHHIKPFHSFGGNWKAANKLSNLICLCPSCHSTIDNALRIHGHCDLADTRCSDCA